MLVSLRVLSASGAANEASSPLRDSLPEYVVEAGRPLRDAGILHTRFDSLALKENPALTMADVLEYNSSVYVKSYGRASLSTISFRGTSPSHTIVTWNSLPVASPMSGVADFSTIPSFFVDKAELLHGASSITQKGGGLGGMVRLESGAGKRKGWDINAVQGVGSFSTFDEFLRVSYGAAKWRVSTRIAYAASKNDFKFRNHDKVLNLYDDNNNIIGRYHPRERNRNGAFHDFHIMQEGEYSPAQGHLIAARCWYSALHRGVPMLSVDYGSVAGLRNGSRDEALRCVAQWRRNASSGFASGIDAGYVHLWNAYDYQRERDEGQWMVMTRSRSSVDTWVASGFASLYLIPDMMLEASASAEQNCVRSRDQNLSASTAGYAMIGYDANQLDASMALQLRYSPIRNLGLALTLRDEAHGKKISPLIPAIYADWMAWQPIGLKLRASAARNYKYPALHDLYFMPGGNPDLKPEKGWSYDAGFSTEFSLGNPSLQLSATWHNSKISDWIIWLPNIKGYFSPRNVKSVHAYGVEVSSSLNLPMARGWLLNLTGNYGYTPSKNVGAPMGDADKSVGRQLPYVPLHSASAVGRLQWRGWTLQYKWSYYSQRYTMSSNEQTLSGRLPRYFMSNVALEKEVSLHRVALNFRLAVNNLFNEDYLSVLSRPMPGINTEFFISISWN